VSVLTWLGSYGGKAVAVALAILVAAAAVNVVLRQDSVRQLKLGLWP